MLFNENSPIDNNLSILFQYDIFKYSNAKYSIGNINDVLGLIVLMRFLHVATFASTRLAEVFNATEYTYILGVLVFLMISWVAIILAAKSHDKVRAQTILLIFSII